MSPDWTPLEPPAQAGGTNQVHTPASTSLARQGEVVHHPSPRPHHRHSVLARFQKSVFSPEAIREYARELNYTARIVDFLRDKLDLRDRAPSEDLVRWILASASIYDRRATGDDPPRSKRLNRNVPNGFCCDTFRRGCYEGLKQLQNDLNAYLSICSLGRAKQRPQHPSRTAYTCFHSVRKSQLMRGSPEVASTYRNTASVSGHVVLITPAD